MTRARTEQERRADPSKTPKVTRRISSYALLGKIIAIVLAEPRRLDMGAWLRRTKDRQLLYETEPDCGTVACIAGWAVALTTQRQPRGSFERAAIKLLSGQRHKWSTLWKDKEDLSPLELLQRDLSELFVYCPPRGYVGEEVYASDTADQIDEFRERHEKLLRKIIITPKGAAR